MRESTEPKRVAITGASGLLGQALQASLRADGVELLRLVRSREKAAAPDALFWDPQGGEIDEAGLAAFAPDAVVHLAGESIAGKRWTEAFKARLMRSRTDSTRLIARACAQLPQPPRVLVSASGSGFYGDTKTRRVDERAPAGEGFLAEICVAWEAAAEPAREAGIRVVHPRFGVVLSERGGALAKMLLAFKLGVGGKLGSGEQFFPFVSLDDTVAALRLCLRDAALEGPVNVVAPETVTNRQFTKALGRQLRRPTIFAVPGFALRLGLGSEMAEALLLEGQGVIPAKLQAHGFNWRHPSVDQAVAAAFSSS